MDLSVFEIKNHSGSYVQKGNELVWDIGSLNVGETYKIWIEVKALTNGTFTNVVNVVPFENKTAGSDNVSVKVIPVVNLTIVKTVDVEKIGLNDYVTFTINVTNIGPSNATNVIIKDVLPNGLIYYDSTGDYDPDDSSLKIPLMKPGDSLEFNIVAQAVDDGNWTNNVYVNCDENGTAYLQKRDEYRQKAEDTELAGYYNLATVLREVAQSFELDAEHMKETYYDYH